MRLDKFLSSNSPYSRSQIAKLVKEKRVFINDTVATKADTRIEMTDQISIDREIITALTSRYLMLNKPKGYVCANKDAEHPIVFDLLSENNLHLLQVAGRLDIDTTGLVLITDDGDWNHRVTSPKKECGKVYRVTTARPICPSTVEHFATGVWLHGEKHPTRPAMLIINDSHNATLTIHEGMYHQVKRMFAATGNHVDALHREQIGQIVLDPTLEPGQYRHLTIEEANSFL